MLYLVRKIGESIVINDSIEIEVVELKGRAVKLGITFPPEASVLRKELFDKIQEENQAASEGSADDFDSDELLSALAAFTGKGRPQDDD